MTFQYILLPIFDLKGRSATMVRRLRPFSRVEMWAAVGFFQRHP